MILIAVMILIFSSVNSLLDFNNNQSSYYADLSASLAKHYRSSCIYFLVDKTSKGTIFMEETIKEIAIKYGISTNVFSFNEYYQLQADGKLIKCHVPIQVVISKNEATKAAFQLYSQSNGMHGSYSCGGAVWLVLLESIANPFLEKYFENIKTPFDSEVIVAELNQNNEMKLKEVYRVQNGSPLRYPDFLKWSGKNSIGFDMKNHLYSRRRNLEGIVLNIGYLDSVPAIYLEEINGEPQLVGYMGDTWKYLEDTFNFTSNITFNKHYGIPDINGNWSGLIGAVQQYIFDAGVADLALTRKRFDAISYSKPLWITTFHTYYQSQQSTREMDVLFLPLEGSLWATLIGWLLISSIILYVGCCLSDQNFQTSDNWTFQNSFFFVAGALCGQGGVNEPKRFTCKMLYFGSFLITGVVVPSYSASLISYLTTLPVYIPFQTMEDFYRIGNLRMTLQHSSYEYEVFSHESSSNPFMNKIFKRDMEPLDPNMFPTSILDGIRAVCMNRYQAYFGTVDDVDYALIQEERREGIKRNCSIANVQHNGGKINLGFIFPKSSPYRGLFNNYFSFLEANGIKKRLQLKYGIKLKSKPSTEATHKPVELQNLTMIFAIVGSGLGASIFCFIIESKLKKQNKVIFLNKKKNRAPKWFEQKKYPEPDLFYHH